MIIFQPFKICVFNQMDPHSTMIWYLLLKYLHYIKTKLMSFQEKILERNSKFTTNLLLCLNS